MYNHRVSKARALVLRTTEAELPPSTFVSMRLRNGGTTLYADTHLKYLYEKNIFLSFSLGRNVCSG
jgi:hypothetical protein